MNVEDWYYDQVAAAKIERAQADQKAAEAYPSGYGTCTGLPTYQPWSAVLGARTKLPRQVDLNKLRRNVFALLGVEP